MGGISLIVAPEVADQYFEHLSKALTEGGMKLNQDKCTAWVSNGEIPEAPLTRNLWNQAKDHRGFIVRGFPATYDDPTKEANIAYPIGSEEFTGSFLEARTSSRQTIMKHTLRIATEASASLPILQSLKCLLRACVTQKVGYLVRITPPDTMAKFAEEIDEMLVDTVCELMQLEEVTPTQRELLLLPISEGGWGLPSLNAIKECAFI